MPLSFPDSSVSSQDLVFSCDWCKEGGYMFLKKGGDIKKRGMKKKGRGGGADTPFRTLGPMFFRRNTIMTFTEKDNIYKFSNICMLEKKLGRNLNHQINTDKPTNTKQTSPINTNKRNQC